MLTYMLHNWWQLTLSALTGAALLLLADEIKWRFKLRLYDRVERAEAPIDDHYPARVAGMECAGDAATHVQRMVCPDLADRLLELRGKPDCTVATRECAGDEKEGTA